jgi:hypothetical protein
MNNKQIVYYQTMCGCLLQRHELIPGPSSKNRRLMCPEHKGEIASKFSHCIKCNAEIRFDKQDIKVKMPTMCQDCNPVKTIRKVRQQKQAGMNPGEFDVLIERSNCIYRPLCREVFIRKNQLPCVGCQDYKPTDDILDNIKYGLDLSELDEYINKGMEEWGMIFVKRLQDLTLKS